MIVKGLIAVGILFVLPMFLGLIITCFFKKEKCNLLLSLIIGYLIEFAICQLVIVPGIYLEWSFTKTYELLKVIFISLFAISVIIFFINIKCIFKNVIEFIKKSPKLLVILSIILIGIQIYAFVGYMHLDDDDSFYVATATTTLETDSLFKYSGTTGQTNLENLISRYRIGPFPIFTAIISKAIDIHPAIVAHIILPIPFIILVYIVYGLIAKKVMNNNLNKTFSFVLLMCILNIFGGYTNRSNSAFLILRIWQGKALLANFILPVVILLFLYAEENDYKFIYMFSIIITLIAAVFTTTMGIGIPVIELALLVLVFEIGKIKIKRNVDENGNKEKSHVGKSILNIIKCALCCIPSVGYLIAYIVL